MEEGSGHQNALVAYVQTSDHSNYTYRDKWVKTKINKYANQLLSKTALDIGAGLCSYKHIFEALGFNYFSQDFDSYSPSKNNPGLQNLQQEYPKHNFVCDVLDISETWKYDFIICTEVFEHVPDSVALIQKLSALTKSDGYILITVPFISLMHQSPYWFTSGLSPFWLEYWAEKLNLEICELEVTGDYIDMMEQEVARLLYFAKPIRGITRLSKVLKYFRLRLPSGLLESGGFGTMCVLRKKQK